MTIIEVSLCVLLSIGFIGTAVWLILLRKRLNMAWYTAIPIAILHTVCGVLTVKAFAFLETGFDKGSLGNMSLFGGVFLMPLAYWLGAKISKRPLDEVFDVFYTLHDLYRHVRPGQLHFVRLLPGAADSGNERDALPNAGGGDRVLPDPACRLVSANLERTAAGTRLPGLHDVLWSVPVYHRVLPRGGQCWPFPSGTSVGDDYITPRRKYLR